MKESSLRSLILDHPKVLSDDKLAFFTEAFFSQAHV